MHLRRLEAAGLVTGTLEVAEDGKTVKYYDVTPFFPELTPRVVAQAAATLTDTHRDRPGHRPECEGGSGWGSWSAPWARPGSSA
ncbi:ArsR/SmtB family transcription factor [Streptomyces anthocyanicus]|uniref:ArsR/SmtB family transcription factor n=1 Tax=Streptomyces anthocyanicus TaxID=68174 RepID=UPI003F4B10C1